MPTVFLNGSFVDHDAAAISAFDAGFQHAVGLFETFLGGVGDRGGEAGVWAFQIDEHLDRLVASASELGLSDSIRADGLREAALETIRRAGLPAARVRLTITGGDLNLLGRTKPNEGASSSSRGPAEHRPSVLIAAQPATVYPQGMYDRGVSAVIASTRANPFNTLEGHKTLSYWWRLRELTVAAQKGAAEAVVLQVSNYLCGGCVSNLLLVKDGRLLSPIARGEEGTTVEPAPGDKPRAGAALPSPVLPGVTRAWALDTATRRGREVVRRMLSINDLLDADEAMLTNSSWGVLPLVRVEGRTISGGEPGPLTNELVGAWRDDLSSAGWEGPAAQR